jgi:septal ring factor EnvC (AmiA/AmiB activator)
MTVWQTIAAICATPSAIAVVRMVAQRMSTSSRAASREVDYLRSEIKRERDECEHERVEYNARIAAQIASHAELREQLASAEKALYEVKQSLKRITVERDNALAIASFAIKHGDGS